MNKVQRGEGTGPLLQRGAETGTEICCFQVQQSFTFPHPDLSRQAQASSSKLTITVINEWPLCQARSERLRQVRADFSFQTRHSQILAPTLQRRKLRFRERSRSSRTASQRPRARMPSIPTVSGPIPPLPAHASPGPPGPRPLALPARPSGRNQLSDSPRPWPGGPSRKHSRCRRKPG